MSKGTSKEVHAEELTIEGGELPFVMVDGVRVRLAMPMVLDFDWIGNREPVHQLMAAWHKSDQDDVAMSPRLIGKPGVGKTALGYSVGKMLNLPVYFFQATSDTNPGDVLINPVVVEGENGESHVEYVASPLVTAMIVGGICVFDEGNRMQEKAWAALAPLLDARRYIESLSVGLVIRAHKDFRFVATMNDDASCFELPEYIKSRLQPQISLDFPDRSEERKILGTNCKHTDEQVLDLVSTFLREARNADEDFSVRDGIQIANYAGKIVKFSETQDKPIDPGTAVTMAVEQIIGVRQARYIKRVLWSSDEEAA